ncbi:MAG: chemotaxis protein CheZ [Rhodospirillaceae bacterium]|nr:chemotaxis protein CheZ [Rhodospirillaceae bacterium]
MTAPDPKKIKEFIETSLRGRNPNMREESIQRTASAVVALLAKEIEFSHRLENLAHFIDQSRSEIAALKPEQVKEEFLPKATDELDAIVQATSEATNRIMDAAEKISGVATELADPQASDLMNAVTSIYEACSFQDITGQRIAKVVTTLKVIEQRIERMVASLSGKPIESDGTDQLPDGWVTGQSAQADIDALFGDASKDSLLHGPAAKGQGTSQADIDALFGDASKS